MGLEGAYRVGEIFKSLNGGQATKGWDDLLWASCPLETPSKDFHLAIGGELG